MSEKATKHHPYTVVEDDQDVFEICEYLAAQTLLALDTETHSNGKRGPKMYDTEPRMQFSDPFINTVRLIQIRSRESESFIFDTRKLSEDGREILRNLLEQPHITWVGHNLKFDYKMLAVNLNVHLAKVYDTYVAAQCLGFATGDQAAVARGYGLKDVLRDYLDVYIDKTEQMSNWSARELTESQLQYAADDLLYLFDLYDLFKKAIDEEYGMDKGVQLEMDVLPVICRMELNGLAIDERMFNLVQQSAAALLPELEEQVCRYIGWPMMPTPPLVRLKTKRMHMAKPINFGGKNGSPLMSNPTMLQAFKDKGIPLENLQGDYLEEVAKNSGHDILTKFVFYRDLTKQLSLTYPDWVNPQTGRLHPTFNQCGASTGRFSCSNPNLQQVPKLDVEVPAALYEANKDILEPYFDESKNKCFLNYRYCFIAEEGHKFLSSDYSGQEVRVMVALSKDPELIRIHHEPTMVEHEGKLVKNMAADVHAKTAELMWGKSHGVTCWNAKSMDFPGLPGKKFRDIAKVIVFGLCGHEDSLVATNSGWRRIKEVKVGDKVVTESGALQRVDSVVCKGNKKTLKVTLKGGYQLEFTPDHPVRVMEPSGQLAWKKLAKVSPEDYLVLRVGSSCSTETALPVVELDRRSVTSYQKVEVPTDWSDELARFLGYFLSEGHSHQEGYTVSYCQTLGLLADDMMHVMKKLFGDRVRIERLDGRGYKEQLRASIHSRDVYNWLDKLEVLGNSANKQIPYFVFQAPKKYQTILINALFAGDGSVKTNGNTVAVSYSSKSEKLVIGIQQLLLALGFTSSRSREYRKDYPDPYHVLRVHEPRRFCAEVGVISKDHPNANKPEEMGREFIPYQKQQAEFLYDKVSVKNLKDLLYNIKVGNSELTHRTLRELNSDPALKEFLIDLQTYADLRFRQIETIEESEAVVYDIGVDVDHCFLANGVVVHNCYGKSAAGLALDWGVTQEEAQAIIDEFFKAYPTLKRWLESKGKEANDTRMSWYGSKEKGVIRWRMVNSGRHADGGALKRAGQNTPIQATSALMMKMALVILDQKLKGTKVKMIGTVHDELMVEIPDTELDKFSDIIRDGMNEAGNFFLSGVIPSSCGIGVSSHWSKD